MHQINFFLINQQLIWIFFQVFVHPLVSRSESTDIPAVYKKVCQGTSLSLTHQGDKWTQTRYTSLFNRYANCTHVDGNLELVFITDPHPDLSFLSTIKEVTGYVLIAATYVDYIPLTSLRVIRGRSLYHDNEAGTSNFYSLYVYLNFDPEDPLNVGLRELGLNSLHEIQSGSVFVQHNNRLCHGNDIQWRDIVTGESSIIRTSEQHDTLHPHVDCESCDSSCEFNGTKYCWGAGAHNCQKLNRLTCSSQCDGQCFGSLPNQCCDSECIGGCVGPSKNQCWACKNFDDNGMCEKFCPPEFVYNPALFKQVSNPSFKYSYGTLCVDKCPDHLNSRQGACVQDCGKGMIADKNRKCVECNGTCPKVCKFDSPLVNLNNIKILKDCTVVQGSIFISELSFQRDKFLNIPPLNVTDLLYMKDIREVYGYVKIQASNHRFKDLSCLQNLQIIHGTKLDNINTALHIFKTSLETLSLNSLKEIRNGAVFISNNSKLCYPNSIQWNTIISSTKQKVIIRHNKDIGECHKDGKVCHPECSVDGCWGPSDDQCLSCNHYYFIDDNHQARNKRCVPSCFSQIGMFQSAPNQCRPCHEECSSNCSGPGADQCDSCKKAKDGPYCVSSCPLTKYRDDQGICRECHQNCEDGCIGPLDYQGPKGCKSCKLPLYEWRDAEMERSISNINATSCLPPRSECPSNYFKRILKPACMKCHPLCLKCFGASVEECTACKYIRHGLKCVTECPSDHYLSIQSTTFNDFPSVESLNDTFDIYGNTTFSEPTCMPCDQNCLRCRGPSNRNCTVCKQYKVLIDDDTGAQDREFYCTEKCPDDKPESMVNNTETICRPIDLAARNKMWVMISSIIVTCLIVSACIILVFCIKKQKANIAIKMAKETMSKANTKEEILLKDQQHPLMEPDMSNLVVIKSSELTVGTSIGSGAYGEVHKGIWKPDGKPPQEVAIKILKENTQELLYEARIMASVKHSCCIKILCVSLSAELMLVTPLMKLGCMLDYVRKNVATISAKEILLWSKQIAMGMEHLELRHIVHCDLAARNVLVDSVNQVKITDFGLAKLHLWKELQLMSSENEVSIKMPVKWLAPESLKTRAFTHKSDVWSYGVTIWELCTFGDRPYKYISNFRDILGILEAGARLERPAICSVKFYESVLECWNGEPDIRPKFSELVETMDSMLRDPRRYIPIKPEHRHSPAIHQQNMKSGHHQHLDNVLNHNHRHDNRKDSNHFGYLTPEPPILYSNLMLLKQQTEIPISPHYNNISQNKEQQELLEGPCELTELTYIPSLSDLSHCYKNDFTPGFLDRPTVHTVQRQHPNSSGDVPYVPYANNSILLDKLLAPGKFTNFESDVGNGDIEFNHNQSEHNYYNELDFCN